MISLSDEFSIIKSDFLSLKEKISSIELRIKLIENEANASNNNQVTLPELHSYVKSTSRLENDSNAVFNTGNISNSAFSVQQDLDKKTRNIIEELMWESTLSKAVLQVRETFKDAYSRETFVRYSFELVLEKDEQYRKMIGTLFGHLLTQNVINQTNIFNSLCSVLMVIENSNNYNSEVWHNLGEILLPIILESHIKLSHLQRKAQAILKQECYREFINYLMFSIEENKKQKFKSDTNKTTVASNLLPQTVSTVPGNIELMKPKLLEEAKNDMKINLINGIQADYVDATNLFDDERYSKCKMSMEDNVAEKENCKHDLENIMQDLLNDNNIDNAARRVEKLHINYDMKTIVEELLYFGFNRECEYRLAIGTLLIKIVSCGLTDFKKILAIVCNHARSVEKLILNTNTRSSICNTFAEILSPLFVTGKIDLNQLTIMASTILPEETKAVFLWMMEKILTERSVPIVSHPVNPQSNSFNDKVIKRLQKFYLDKSERSEPSNGNGLTVPAPRNVANENNIPKPRRTSAVVKIDLPTHEPISEKQEKPLSVPEIAEQDNFLLMKRKKLLKERIENTGDKSDIKIDDLIADQNVRRNPETEAGDAQVKVTDSAKADADMPPVKQPENLPSSAIKEKMEEIIEHLMENGDMEGCIATIRDSFNECQTDLVFKAAFEYTKGKESEYRIQAGTLISEAFKHDPRRVGAQIMNTISLELGDFVDSPELWKGMAEIICPPMIFGLIRFNDLKLLPKYFKHTPYCASLLSALFREILRHKGPEWLEESWKRSKLDLTAFLANDEIYKFITDNDLNFMMKDGELTHYKENASET